MCDESERAPGVLIWLLFAERRANIQPGNSKRCVDRVRALGTECASPASPRLLRDRP